MKYSGRRVVSLGLCVKSTGRGGLEMRERSLHWPQGSMISPRMPKGFRGAGGRAGWGSSPLGRVCATGAADLAGLCPGLFVFALGAGAGGGGVTTEPGGSTVGTGSTRTGGEAAGLTLATGGAGARQERTATKPSARLTTKPKPAASGQNDVAA